MYKTLRKNYQWLTAFCLTAVFIFNFSGCQEDENPGGNNSEENVKLSNNIMVNSDGFSLYFFTKDVSGESNCPDGSCLTNWPIFFEETINAGTGLNDSDFGTITRDDGKKQSTYKGWPLYFYAGDNAAGQVNGDGVGSIWFAAKPDYSIMLANEQLVGNDGKNYTSDFQEGDGETQFFVDQEGNTLYLFKNDFKDQNNFTAEDFSNNGSWPIFYTDINSLPSTLNASDFGIIDVYGETQVTYKGWPLYYFGSDGTRGDTKGVSVPTPGVWPIVNTNTTAAPEPPPTVMTTEDATLGTILTDGDGVTLYFFSNDADGNSSCTGGCLDSWPKFYAENLILPEGSSLNPINFGTIGEGDEEQTTYKGWPLYYYAPDGDGVIEDAGETAGDGVFGVWYVANPNFSLMIANAQLVGSDGKNYKSDYSEGDEVTKFFTDSKGKTIYIFSNDAKDTNNFTNEDASHNAVWPIFYVEIDQLPSGMNPDDFGEIDVFGEPQLTFRGWPLYYFYQDEGRGDTKGVSFPSPGVWPIANNDTEAAQ